MLRIGMLLVYALLALVGVTWIMLFMRRITPENVG